MSDVPEKYCSGCDRMLPTTTEFFHADIKRGKLYSRCKICHNKSTRQSDAKRKAKKHIETMLNGHNHDAITLDEIGTRCDSCGIKNGNILSDIDEITKERYGYLCMKCYRLVHTFQADHQRIRSILAYIETTRLVPAT